MNLPFSFRPKIFDALKDYTAQKFYSDFAAGLTVGIVALPLSMALAIASGLKPEIGLFASIIAGILVAVFGGSRVQIGGPAGAFVPLLAPIVMKHGPEALVVCALMAGVILIVLGACKLGSLIKYIPFPVVTGFTSGIAVIIMSTQIRDFFGLQEKLPPDFIGKIQTLTGNFHPNWPTVLVATICTLAIWFWPKKIGHYVPGSIAIVVLAGAASAFFNWPTQLGIQTLGTTFGEMPRSLPLPHWPSLAFEEWRALIPAAMTVAVLGAIESLLSAVVSDGMIDDRHDSNQELMGQGIANIAMGIFGCMPATGVIARTATNIRCGGRTPVAAIVHSLTVLVILIVAAPLAEHIPLAVLSAVLVVVSLRMGGVGGICAIDGGFWVVLAFYHYVRKHEDWNLLAQYAKQLERLMNWLHGLDSNNDGLLEIPEAGDWTDLFGRSYHVLYDQVLWYGASVAYGRLLEFQKKFEDASAWLRRAQTIRNKILASFWPSTKPRDPSAHISFADQQFAVGDSCYLLAEITPFAFNWRCDVLGNILAFIGNVLDVDRARTAFRFMWGVGVNEPYPVTNLYPPVQAGDPDWRSYYTVNLLNLPGHYHNGGIWPFIGGMWVRFIHRLGLRDVACRELLKLAQANRLGKNQEWEFNEWIHSRTGRPMGKAFQAWSASSFIHACHELQISPESLDRETYPIDTESRKK